MTTTVPAITALIVVAEMDPSLAHAALETSIARHLADGEEMRDETINGNRMEYYREELTLPGAVTGGDPIEPVDISILHMDYYSAPLARSSYADGSEMLSLPDDGFGVLKRSDGTFLLVTFS